MRKLRHALCLTLALSFHGQSHGQNSAAALEGRVVDADAKPIPEVQAVLRKAKLATGTDSAGYFRFAGAGPLAVYRGPSGNGGNGFSLILGGAKGAVEADLLDLRGRVVASLHPGSASPGSDVLPFDLPTGARSVRDGLYRLRFSAGGNRAILPAACIGGAWSLPRAGRTGLKGSLGKSSAATVVDTLFLKKQGFATKAIPLEAYAPLTSPIIMARDGAPQDTVIYRSAALEIRLGVRSLILLAPAYQIDVDLSQGVYHVRAGGVRMLTRAFSEAVLEDGRKVQGPLYASHVSGRDFLEPLQDGFGKGIRLTVEHSGVGLPTLRERFLLYDERPYFLVQAELSSAGSLAANYVSPLSIEPGQSAGADLGTGSARALSVPWDNDRFVRYAVAGDGEPRESYGVAALFDNVSRNGMVVGSVTHDLWKTGIRMRGLKGAKLAELRVYGGAADSNTHDQVPHGMVRGVRVASPLIFVGRFADWRAGMEEFGRACALAVPALSWTRGVPFGWNSWDAVGANVKKEDALAASDFLKTEFMDGNLGLGGEVYINLDSFWDNMGEAALRDLAKRIHANGQKAGIYWTPFTFWGGVDDLGWGVEGSGGKYTFKDAILRNSQGQPVPAPDGGFVMDPSHPGTLGRNDLQMQRFIDWGFDFIKLDFLNYGALEGKHFDSTAMTGTAAYRIGMDRIRKALDPARIGRPFLIDLAISPVFPYQFAHGRRLSCDVFGHIEDTEYMLNSLAGGWWMNKTLYAHTDPDVTVLYKSFNQTPSTEMEARSRFVASVIAGTMMLMSDSLRDEAAKERYRKFLADKEVNALALRGKAFRPVESDTGRKSAGIFILDDREKGDFHLAVFNFTGSEATKTLSPERLGLGAGSWRLYDLWTKTSTPLTSGTEVILQAAEARLYRVER